MKNGHSKDISTVKPVEITIDEADILSSPPVLATIRDFERTIIDAINRGLDPFRSLRSEFFQKTVNHLGTDAVALFQDIKKINSDQNEITSPAIILQICLKIREALNKTKIPLLKFDEKDVQSTKEEKNVQGTKEEKDEQNPKLEAAERKTWGEKIGDQLEFEYGERSRGLARGICKNILGYARSINKKLDPIKKTFSKSAAECKALTAWVNQNHSSSRDDGTLSSAIDHFQDLLALADKISELPSMPEKITKLLNLATRFKKAFPKEETIKSDSTEAEKILDKTVNDLQTIILNSEPFQELLTLAPYFERNWLTMVNTHRHVSEDANPTPIFKIIPLNQVSSLGTRQGSIKDLHRAQSTPDLFKNTRQTDQKQELTPWLKIEAFLQSLAHFCLAEPKLNSSQNGIPLNFARKVLQYLWGQDLLGLIKTETYKGKKKPLDIKSENEQFLTLMAPFIAKIEGIREQPLSNKEFTNTRSFPGDSPLLLVRVQSITQGTHQRLIPNTAGKNTLTQPLLTAKEIEQITQIRFEYCQMIKIPRESKKYKST